jgi:transposase InsO family protein
VAAFIAAHRGEHLIPHTTACRAMSVSPPWFCRWRDGDASPRHARGAQLAIEIDRLFAARDAGWTVSDNTVAALMRELGLAARRRKRRKSTTRQGRGRWRALTWSAATFPAIEQYNHDRRRSSLGMLPPIDFEGRLHSDPGPTTPAGQHEQRPRQAVRGRVWS